MDINMASFPVLILFSQPYLVVVVCDVFTVAKRCVLQQKLLLTAYRKSHIGNQWMQKMNDLDLCLEVV